MTRPPVDGPAGSCHFSSPRIEPDVLGKDLDRPRFETIRKDADSNSYLFSGINRGTMTFLMMKPGRRRVTPVRQRQLP